MGRYILSRALSAVLALLAMSVLAFCATALVPGDPASVLLGTYATPERVEQVTEELGLDKPLVVRYFYWLRATLQGDLGESALSHQPVTTLLGNALEVTLELALGAILLAVVFAIPLGLLLGLYREKRWTKPILVLVNLGMSVPGFWLGLMLIVIFSVKFRIFPAGGFVSLADDPVANLQSMVLPWITLSLWFLTPLVRFTRTSTIGVIDEDYVTTARSKGMSETRRLAFHVAPNAAIPTLTFLGLQLGALVSGATITEVIFSLPGMGRLGLNAILARDYAVVQAVILAISAGYILINFAIDIAYGLIDPRVRHG